jgi:DNA-binding transcriptional LysR family regulator
MRLPLATLEVFDAIARAGSLRGAAEMLAVTPSTISHQLKTLEEQVGAALFIRTTRSVNLTEAGRTLLRDVAPAFEQINHGLTAARSAGHSARGSLRLAVPEFAYFLLLKDRLAEFQRSYPEIEVELVMTDALSDVIGDGMHAGFRLGGLVDQDMIAVPLTEPLRSVVVASPRYLETYGVPAQPQDLLDHNCLRYRFPSSGHIAPWAFEGPDGVFQVVVRGTLIADSSPVAIDMARGDLGLTFTFRDYCLQDLKQGQLVEVLTDYQAKVPAVHFYYPREYRNMVPLKLLLAHLQDR